MEKDDPGSSNRTEHTLVNTPSSYEEFEKVSDPQRKRYILQG